MSTNSDLFRFLYDEAQPVGAIGRGTHYSVARVAEWRDALLRTTETALIHDFAIIWDEDHDERVIQVLEKLYLKGLLAPVLYAGERKGSLSLILDPSVTGADPRFLVDYEEQVADLAAPDGDAWSVEITLMGDGRTRIIADSAERMDTYLRNIRVLWGLGLRESAALKPPVDPLSCLNIETT
jgi:hypothetical protein